MQFREKENAQERKDGLMWEVIGSSYGLYLWEGQGREWTPIYLRPLAVTKSKGENCLLIVTVELPPLHFPMKKKIILKKL